MIKHRVRQAKSTGENPAPHTFVEYSEDNWLEVSTLPTHDRIEAYNTDPRKPVFMSYHTRAFDLDIVRDWWESGFIS